MKRPRCKVTFYSDAAYYGGAEKYLALLARHLDPERFRLTAILPDRPPVERLEREMAEAGAEIARHERLGMRWWSSFGDLRALLARIGGDLLHINLPSTYDAALSSIAVAAKISGYRRVVTTEHLPVIDRKYKRFPIKLLMSEAIDAVILPSFATRECLTNLHRIAQEKTVVLPLGIETPPPPANGTEAELRERTGTPADATVVAVVGRLHPRKGHRHLFDALALLRERGRLGSTRLWVIGEGEDKEGLIRHAAERELEETVRFLGPREDAASLMQLIDILAVPSLVETTPFVIIEAMAAGRPVVASRIYGIPEMIEDGGSGLLVKPCDPSGLAEALGALLEDPDLRRRFGERGQDRFTRLFSATVMARATERVYLDETGGRAR